MSQRSEASRTALRVAAFVAALAVVLVAAVGAGRLVGPLDVAPATAQEGAHGDAHADAGDTADDTAGDHTDDHADEADEAAASTADVSGLTARADGFTLELADGVLEPGRRELAFRVLTSSGRPLLDYTEAHEKDLHLIVVRRDLTGFQHVHPTLDRATGTWSTRVRLTPGTWRVVADLVPEGWDPITLADDLAVPGEFRPTRLPADDRSATVPAPGGDYTVSLEGDTAPGTGTVLTARVERDGVPVTDLQPYLGARGHLVAMRAGDLGYLHVHPEEGQDDESQDDEGSGATIAFATEFPTHGTYRLFLDFKHGGRVHTADFTVEASGAPGGDTHGDEHGDEDGEDDHDH